MGVRISGRWLLAVPVAGAAAMYARFFGGYWLGDDFGNLRTAWLAVQQGEWVTRAWMQLFAAVPSQGAFYRPAMIASLLFNEWLAGPRFAGWFAWNYATHLVNVLLVGMLVARLSAQAGRDGRISAAVAAGFFALSPLLAEGVFWVSARADAAVTLLTLAGVLSWARSPASPIRAAVLPLCLVPALAFKEPAAVLPFQMSLVALAWPSRLSRARIAAVVACFALTGLFFAVRAHLFGHVWQVYPVSDTASLPVRFWHALGSAGEWWRGLARQTPAAAAAYMIMAPGAALLLVFAARGPHARLAAALLAASAGLWAATLLNLGAMSDSGEGGRLEYSAIAWLALALGAAGAAPETRSNAVERTSAYRRAGLALLTAALVVGAAVLEGQLRLARYAQDDMRALAQAARQWAVGHPGLTLLIVDGRIGPVVTARNAQGGLVMPPIQPASLLHRVLPTLPGEIELRYDQLDAGLAARLDATARSHTEATTAEEAYAARIARWPEHYACWSSREHRIIEGDAPDPANRTGWVNALHDEIARCGIGDEPGRAYPGLPSRRGRVNIGQ